MSGDYSRESFDPRRHFSAVRMQQGRVALDADWNEQGAIVEGARAVSYTHLTLPTNREV